MGFESSLTREQISVNNPELTVLSLREFCMLSKENLLRMDDMTPDKVAAIERLLAEYSLRLGMSDVELETYLNRYYEENPKEKAGLDKFRARSDSVAILSHSVFFHSSDCCSVPGIVLHEIRFHRRQVFCYTACRTYRKTPFLWGLKAA